MDSSLWMIGHCFERSLRRDGTTSLVIYRSVLMAAEEQEVWEWLVPRKPSAQMGTFWLHRSFVRTTFQNSWNDPSPSCHAKENLYLRRVWPCSYYSDRGSELSTVADYGLDIQGWIPIHKALEVLSLVLADQVASFY